MLYNQKILIDLRLYLWTQAGLPRWWYMLTDIQTYVIICLILLLQYSHWISIIKTMYSVLYSATTYWAHSICLLFLIHIQSIFSNSSFGTIIHICCESILTVEYIYILWVHHIECVVKSFSDTVAIFKSYLLKYFTILPHF